MTIEVEAVVMLGELLKAGALQKRALQFHDVVIKESRKLRQTEKTARGGTYSIVPRLTKPKAVKTSRSVKPLKSVSSKQASYIGPGGNLSKLATSSSVPRDISQVSTDQRPGPAELEESESEPTDRKRVSKNPLKVVL